MMDCEQYMCVFITCDYLHSMVPLMPVLWQSCVTESIMQTSKPLQKFLTICELPLIYIHACTSHAHHMYISCTSHAYHIHIKCTSHAHHILSKPQEGMACPCKFVLHCHSLVYHESWPSLVLHGIAININTILLARNFNVLVL